jgi:hypothetical protein
MFVIIARAESLPNPWPDGFPRRFRVAESRYLVSNPQL